MEERRCVTIKNATNLETIMFVELCLSKPGFILEISILFVIF